jgi:hypothetical protein
MNRGTQIIVKLRLVRGGMFLRRNAACSLCGARYFPPGALSVAITASQSEPIREARNQQLPHKILLE